MTQTATLSEVRTACPLFFSRGALRFFNSRVGKRTYCGPGGVFFTSSERCDWGPDHVRAWTVRQFKDGMIRTAGAFQAFDSSESARAEAKKLASG